MVTRGETYIFVLYKRKKNSSYEYEDTPKLMFKGRPAKPIERNGYAIQSGVMGGIDDAYIISSNLPSEVSVGDRVFYLGKFWQVTSIGVYYESLRVVNASIMSAEKLMESAPKGITLK